MSIRGEGAGASGADGQERRAGGGQRVHFEALVAVGESQGGGFEAESIDVSADGMRLRTAYLPEVGDKLVCRFDGMGAEVVAEGEVIWRNQEARGGEFGLRFVGLDAATAEAVRGMVGSLGDGPGEPADELPAVLRGARVRLHIEGLGSPMKARVREAASREVEVGSNLEFLKVGRSLELEDVDQGKKREATIEHVKVDVDPATNVPQLVVSLRYESAEAARASEKAAAPSTTKRASVRPPSAPVTRRAPATLASEDSSREIEKEPAEADARDEAAEASESDADAVEGAAAGMGARAAKAGRAVAGKIAPALAGVSARARGAMAGLLATVQKKRAERAETAKAGAPRRMTAPPPGGALKSEGRRLVREDGEEGEDAPVVPLRSNRRAAAVGGALGLAAVIAVFGATRMAGSHASTTSTDGAHAAAIATAAPIAAADTASPAPSGTPTAGVPLFGATPLSTTETVPANPAPSGTALAAAAPPSDPGAADGEDDGAPAADGKSGPPLKEWGQGTVSHPVTLKLKMDGPIERINGAAGAMGFTISLPDRRSISTASDLARKDKRLASVNVVNTSHGAEVTVQFKDGVPPYLAKVKGDRLEIALGSEGHDHKKVAKAKGDKSKKASKKKHK